MQTPARSKADRAPGRIGFNEHAETGIPLARRRNGTRWEVGAGLHVHYAVPPSSRPRSNGPAHADHLVGMGMVVLSRDNYLGGHKISVFGSPFSSISRNYQPPEFAAPWWTRQPRILLPANCAQVIPSAHSRPPRPHASPPHLAECPSSPPRRTLGGKARWQKRFVFPARRMRRGLQF